MPAPELYAEIRAAGGVYRDWTAVEVSMEYGSPTREFAFNVAEIGSRSTSWASVKLKPGDEVEIRLAGILVIRGYVIVRSPQYDANSHILVLQGLSRTTDIVDSSARPGQFRGYTFEQISRGLLKPHKIDLVTRDLPELAGKPFRNFMVHGGTTVWEAIERAARFRGVYLTCDAESRLVATQGIRSAGPGAVLEEGINILAAGGTLRDDTIFSRLSGEGQQQGSDDVFGRRAAEVGASSSNSLARSNRELILAAEQTMDTDEAKARVDREVAKQTETSIDLTVVVPGWFSPTGKLWEPTESVTIKSPMIFPTPADGARDLAIRRVTFAQGPRGTTTTLGLCLPNALTNKPGEIPRDQVPSILNAKGAPAIPIPIDGALA